MAPLGLPSIVLAVCFILSSVLVASSVGDGLTKNLEDSTVCQESCYGEEIYVMFAWDNQKYLILIIDEDPTSILPTFQLDEIQYYEGNKLWYSSDVKGFRGVYGAEVVCEHTSLSLTYDGEKTQTFKCEKAVSSTRRRSLKRGGITESKPIVKGSHDSEDSQKRTIVFHHLSIKHGKDSDIVKYKTSCRTEPDLSLALSISGGVSCVVLVGIVGITLLVFS